ncbi:MAG: hypothetical protein JKX81_07535 [Arenicella sp.]|nr:hypothetical protein [Arenicella sp.]
MIRFSKTLIACTLALGLSSNALAQCNAPAAPIIPDGNVASEDELVAAQRAYKAFEKKFFDYRDCLTAEEAAIDPVAANFQEQKAIINAADNAAFEELNQVANEFNSAVKAFKSK